MSANTSNAWPEEIARLLQPGGLADYIADKGWSYGALARRTEMDPEYLKRIARTVAPVKVVLAVVKATELTSRKKREQSRGGKPAGYWVRVLQRIEPSLTEAQCLARIKLAHPLTGAAQHEVVEQIGMSYGELGSLLGIDKTHVLRAVHDRRPTGKGIQAVLDLLYEKTLSRAHVEVSA